MLPAEPPRVGRLLLSRSPPAVSRLVIPVVVYPIKSQRRRSRPHVLQKRDKANPPTLANSDPAPAVVSIGLVSGVLAPRSHALPNVVLGCSGRAVGREASDAVVPQKAPTARCGARLQVTAADGRFHPAVAATAPLNTASGCVPPEDNQPPEAPAFERHESATKLPALARLSIEAAAALHLSPHDVGDLVLDLAPAGAGKAPAAALGPSQRCQSIEGLACDVGEGHAEHTTHTAATYKWARQVKGRAKRLAEQMRTGTRA